MTSEVDTRAVNVNHIYHQLVYSPDGVDLSHFTPFGVDLSNYSGSSQVMSVVMMSLPVQST